jgi:hypothetical protein
VLTLGAIHLMRMAGGWVAPDLPLSVPLSYLVITGAVWGVAWVAVALALYTGRRWAPQAMRVVGAAFLLWAAADRLLFVRSEYALRTLPFSLAVTFLGVALVLWVLRRPAVRRFFGEHTQ